MTNPEDEMFRLKKELGKAMEKTARMFAARLRIFGIEMSPKEAMQIMREEQINAYRQILRDGAVKSIIEGSNDEE